MGNIWLYKNHHHHFKPKSPIVLLQERCEIVQFKFGHPDFQVNIQGIQAYFPELHLWIVLNPYIHPVKFENIFLIQAY